MSNFEKIKTFSEISNEEIAAFAKAAIESFISNPVDVKKDNLSRVKTAYDNDELEQIKLDFAAAGINLIKFMSFPLKFIKNWESFSFLSTVFPGIVADDMRVLIMSGPGHVIPHIDQASRKFVLNFPIQNCAESLTHFHRLIKPLDRLVFRFSEIELVETFQYQEKTSYVLNTSIPHSIELVNDVPRIMLSYAITDKKEFARLVENL